MSLTPRQRRALEDICDTFCPAGNGAPTARELGVAAAGVKRFSELRRDEREACDPAGQTWDVRDLYVLDGSSFPTASGVNPQISIQAIAHMCARGLAAKLG